MLNIGLFGRKNDPHIIALRDAVRREGGRPWIVDFHNFPRFNLASLGSSASFDDIHLPDVIPLDDLDAACVRSICFSRFDPERMDTVVPNRRAVCAGREAVSRHYRAEIEKIAFQMALLRRLEARIPLVNPQSGWRFHRQKALQHQLLLRNGIPTPSAIITNDVDRIRDFLDRFDGRVVVKPQASGAEVVMANEEFLQRNSDILRARPFMFQQYVKGRAIRAYVLGGRVVSMGEILYDKRHVDWRERTKGVRPCEPTLEVEEWIRDATRLLNLPFCSIDLEEDEYTQRTYFLDFNPSAYFLVWSRRTGVDIAGNIVAYLMGRCLAGE